MVKYLKKGNQIAEIDNQNLINNLIKEGFVEIPQNEIDTYLLQKKKQEDKTDLRKISAIQNRLEQLSQDFIQAQAGAIFEDMEERKKEFQSLHNELRVLLGKEPRQYLEVTNETNN